MRAIEINPELGSVKEKFYGFELSQIFYVILAGAVSLYLNFQLPTFLGTFRGIISSTAAVPFILIAIKDFYGLKGFSLAGAVVTSMLNNRPLIFETETIWKEVKRKC